MTKNLSKCQESEKTNQILGIKEILLLSPFSHQTFLIQSDFYYQDSIETAFEKVKVTLLTNPKALYLSLLSLTSSFNSIDH